MKKFSIVVGGCSFVHDADSFAHAWKRDNFKDSHVYPVGNGASGNALNVRTTLSALERAKKNDPDSKIICVFEVTTPNRHEFLIRDDVFEPYEGNGRWERCSPYLYSLGYDSHLESINSDVLDDILSNSKYDISRITYTLSGGPRTSVFLKKSMKNYEYHKFWADYYDRYHTEELGWINTFQSILLLQNYCKANDIQFQGLFIRDQLSYFFQDHNSNGCPYAEELYNMIDWDSFWFYDKLISIKEPKDNVVFVDNTTDVPKFIVDPHGYYISAYDDGEVIKYGGISEWIVDNGYRFDGHPDPTGHAAFADYFEPMVRQKMS